MKKILIFLLVIIVTVILTKLSESFFNSNDSESDNQIVFASIPSAILNETRELIIHLPPGFDATKKYPIMYVLDGSSLDYPVAQISQTLFLAGYAPETIVVGIPNMSAENRERNLTPPFLRRNNDDLNSLLGEANLFLDFIEQELVPFMEQRYSASGIRSICGHSRGGLTVVYSLIYKPGLFQAQICFSAPLWRQDNILISKVSEYLNSKDSVNTFLYLSAGEKETDNIRNGLAKMVSTLEEKKIAGLTFHSDITPRADHQSNSRLSAPRAIALWSGYLRHLNESKPIK